MAAISEIVRGGATRLEGALLASAAISAASSGLGAETLAASNSAAFGRAAVMAPCTHALTLGPAFSRQDSRVPPPLRMQATTIGLPTVLRQFSIAWLSSRAKAEGERTMARSAATPSRAIDFITGFPRGTKSACQARISIVAIRLIEGQRDRFSQAPSRIGTRRYRRILKGFPSGHTTGVRCHGKPLKAC